MHELRAEMLPKVVERLKALADENRIRLLLRLRKGKANVNELTEELGISQGSVSKHLAVLKQVGLVEARQQGTQSIYRIRDESVFDLCETVCNGVIRHLQQEHAALGLPAMAGRRKGERS
jgi:DNA-binding transcriptional ArsR family regulator